MSKQPTFSSIESLFESSKDYAEKRIELLKLKAVDKSSKVFSTIISAVLLLVIFTVFFMLFSIGLGFFIGDLVGEVYLGFFIVAGFYAIVGLVLYMGKKVFFRNPIANRLIRKLL